MHRGHSTALVGWGLHCHSGQWQIPFCQWAGTHVIAESWAIAGDNYAENQQWEGINICCGARMGAKLHVQWTMKDSLIYAIRKSRIVSGIVMSRRKRRNWHKEVKLVMQGWLKRWVEFVKCLNATSHWQGTELPQSRGKFLFSTFSLSRKSLCIPNLFPGMYTYSAFASKISLPPTPNFWGLFSIISRILWFHILPSSSPPLSVNLRWDF